MFFFQGVSITNSLGYGTKIVNKSLRILQNDINSTSLGVNLDEVDKNDIGKLVNEHWVRFTTETSSKFLKYMFRFVWNWD